MIRSLLVLLLFANIATAQITIDAPAMPIHRIHAGLLLADKEDCIALTTVAGKLVAIPCSIDATYIRGLGMTKWVDACECYGLSEDGYAIRLKLPKERVDATAFRGSIARAMISPGWLTDPNGNSRAVKIYWPDCHAKKVGRGSFLADAVRAFEVK